MLPSSLLASPYSVQRGIHRLLLPDLIFLPLTVMLVAIQIVGLEGLTTLSEEFVEMGWGDSCSNDIIYLLQREHVACSVILLYNSIRFTPLAECEQRRTSFRENRLIPSVSLDVTLVNLLVEEEGRSFLHTPLCRHRTPLITSIGA